MSHVGDEYDVPLKSAYLNGYYDEMVDFIRSLFEAALKTNPHLEFAVLTGCLRISKESIFTGINNLEIISILNKNYDEYFGNGYVVKSNREGGTGRTDLFIRPGSRRKTAYVVEFKVAKTYRELASRAEDALAQIAEKSYARELIDDGYETVVCYGISFFGKDCEVRISQKE